MSAPELSSFKTTVDRGRPRIVEAIWIVIQEVFISSFIPGSMHRRWLMRLFGAKIGKNVVLKPRIRIKFPWKLEIGDHTWIGEGAWIDNIAHVAIGSNCCLSQGCYLCTGNHNWKKPSFDLEAQPITISDGAWIAAQSVVGPGVAVGKNAIVGLGAVLTCDLEESAIYSVSGMVSGSKRSIAERSPIARKLRE